MEQKDLNTSSSTVHTEISLRLGESIFLETPHWPGHVTVVEIREDDDRPDLKTRLAIVMPKEISIHRGEIYDLILPRRSE